MSIVATGVEVTTGIGGGCCCCSTITICAGAGGGVDDCAGAGMGETIELVTDGVTVKTG